MNKILGRIFIHDSVQNPAFQKGVDRCYVNYASALVETFLDDVIIYSKRKLGFNNGKQFFPPSMYLSVPMPNRLGVILDAHYGRALTRKISGIYYSPFYGKIVSQIPQIFSAHDMIFEKYPKYFSDGSQKRFIQEKKDCFDRSALILCVSQSTANDIAEFYPKIPENKIKIIHNGVDNFFFEDDAKSYLGKPYFLFVGNRGRYKNFLRLLTVFGKSGLSKQFCLRIISPINDFPTENEKEIIAKYHLESEIFVEVSVTDFVLRNRYQHAFAYICPSEYEGFGLPIIEAMACGTIVISSNTSSLPEIGGTVPVFFDPNSLDSITEALFEVALMTDEERMARVNRGKIRASIFSWQTAKKRFIDAITPLI